MNKNKKPKHGGYPEPKKKANDKFLTPERMEKLKGQIIRDKGTMQAMMHYYGCDDFLELMVQVLYNASEEMEDIHKKTSELYRTRATQLNDILEDK